MRTRITVSYKELLQVALELPYYVSGAKGSGPDTVPDISLTPDAETITLLRRMDVVMRATPEGCIFFARVEGQSGGGTDLLRFPVLAGDKITLLMRLNNPQLLNMYDLPSTPDTSRLIYLCNKINDVSAPRKALHLSAGPAGISGNSDQLNFIRDIYRYHHGMPVDAATAVIRHQLTSDSVNAQSCVNTSTGADLLFDLSILPGGVCELWIDAVKEATFYHLADHSSRPVFGVIELMLDALPGTNYRIVESDRSLTAERPRFIAGFTSRKTYWRYTFKLQSSGPLAQEIGALSTAGRAAFLAQMNVLTNDPTISFAPDPSSTEQQLVFTSGSTVNLQDVYKTPTGAALSLDLAKNTADPLLKAYVKRWLPLPSSGMINASAGSNIYSDLFITI